MDTQPSPPVAASQWECAIVATASFTRPVFQTADMETQHGILDELARLVDAGIIRTTLTENFGTINAANLRRAHAFIESGKVRGKIVLEGW